MNQKISDPDALVLIPGLMSDDAVWQAPINALKNRLSVLVIDHQGLDSLEAMAAKVLDQAPPRFALAGHSMGGRVALDVMRQSPERVTHLALIDTACQAIQSPEAEAKEREIRFGFLELAQKYGLERMARHWVQNMVHPDRLQDEVLIKTITDMFGRQSIGKYSAQIKALLNRRDAFPLLKSIGCPTLVLCGREDASTTVAVHEEMMTALPNATLVIVDHCGHMSMLEQPEVVTSAMMQWLAK